MFNRNSVLITILIILVGASALLLYGVFSNRPLPLEIVPKSVSDQDVIIRNEADKLEISIQKSIRKLQNGGELDVLVSSPQFKTLSDDSILEIEVGPTGRPNPFVPVRYSPL